MFLNDALNQIIDDGIEAARADYRRPEQSLKLDGAIRGFEDCRGISPEEIGKLVESSRADAERARTEDASRYWFWRCRNAEMEWTANVLSCILHVQGLPIVGTMTARGQMKAAEIIGVASVSHDMR